MGSSSLFQYVAERPDKDLKHFAGQKDLQLEKQWKSLVLTYKTQIFSLVKTSVEWEKHTAVLWGSCRRTGGDGNLL